MEVEQRPREKALRYGLESLSDLELVALILQNANSVLIAHNHPSGDCTPSKADFEVTYKMVHVAMTMGVNLIDHIIVGQNQYYSFKEHKYLD